MTSGETEQAVPIHVIGASGRSGAALCHSLLADGTPFVPVVRDRSRWLTQQITGVPRIADLTDQAALSAALHDAARIACCAHARHTPVVLEAAPEQARFVFLGSTRKFTRWPDAHATGVIAGEAAFLASGRQGVMLHPTMIYGAAGEDNVQRLASLLRYLPLVPLPGGGRAQVQPIHQDDVTSAIRAALDIEWTGPEAIVIAGPDPQPYAAFLRAVAAAARLPSPRIIPLPARWLAVAARVAALLPGLPKVRPDEIRRLLEDKAFDIGPMRDRLGIEPVALEPGLARTFTRSQKAMRAHKLAAGATAAGATNADHQPHR